MSSLFSLRFWFDLDSTPISTRSALILFVVFALLIVAGIGARVTSARFKKDRYKHRLWQRAAQMGVTMGFIGLIIFFFLFENVRLLGAHFWLLFWAIGLLAWIGWLVYLVMRVTPAMKARDALLEMRDRYLPKKR